MNTIFFKNHFTVFRFSATKHFSLLLVTTAFALFMASCAEEDGIEEIVNTSANISAEQTEFETYRGAEIGFNVTFKDWKRKDYYDHSTGEPIDYGPDLIFKIDNVILPADYHYSESGPLNKTEKIKVKISTTITYGAKQIKIYDQNGKFLIDGPKVIIINTYMLAVVRDLYNTSPPAPFRYRWSVVAGFAGMCKFDEQSVMLKTSSYPWYISDSGELEFGKFSFGEFTPDKETNFTYNFEMYKTLKVNNIRAIFPNDLNETLRIGLNHFDSTTDYFFGYRNDIGKSRIFISTDTDQIPQEYQEESISQIFERKIIKDLETTSAGILYALELESSCIKKIEKEGQTSIIGSETVQEHKDGTVSTALFDTIVAISMGQGDNLYVAEANRIREITPSGTVSTIYDKDFKNIRDIYAMKDGRIYVFDEEKIKILNKEHTQLTVFSLRRDPENSLGVKVTFTMPMCVSDNGIIYLFMQNGQSGLLALTCLVPEEMVPDKTLEKYPNGLFLTDGIIVF
ncbi:MAG: hypothetical protein LBU22_05085 [Dysgonamonadaceae bacterium]|jgi:hypothetical protein|nr:hypothetical protein [Dysgonamonadaceae bacterium]